MTWYRTGTVAVTNGSANVTLTGGDALANIFPDDGFIGPDGKTYGIATIGGAGSFTLQTNYDGATASGQAYGIIPVADYVQLRDQIEAVNTLITAYQTIAINAGVGLFAPGNAAAPGVRGQGHTGTGLVWNGDNTLSVSVAGTIVATFTTGGNRFPDGTVGAPGMSFVSDTNTGIYRSAADTLGIVTGGASRVSVSNTAVTSTINLTAPELHIDANHYIGASSSNNRDYWFDTGDVLRYSRDINQLAVIIGGTERIAVIPNGFRATVPGGGQFFIEQAGTTSVQIRSSATLRYIAAAASAHQFYIDGSSLVQIGPTALTPGSDNSVPLGSASFRWSVVYAATGTINTSDEREKTWRGAPTAAELKAATAIIAELGFYQWNDAVADKGDDARFHFGPRAQRVWSIMADEGLIDPIKKGKPGNTPYAFLCYDEWKADKEAGIKAGNRYGVRTDQLIMFLIAAQEARIAAIEERLNND